MTDVHTKGVRSYNMSQIKGKDSKPEILVRRFLFSNGFRYHIHNKNLPGKPDIVLTKHKSIVFIHGCFWHGHKNCKQFVIPKTRTEWWLNKINGNIRNDIENIKSLENKGWKVFVIWSCDLTAGKREKSLQELLQRLKFHNINEVL